MNLCVRITVFQNLSVTFLGNRDKCRKTASITSQNLRLIESRQGWPSLSRPCASARVESFRTLCLTRFNTDFRQDEFYIQAFRRCELSPAMTILNTLALGPLKCSASLHIRGFSWQAWLAGSQTKNREKMQGITAWFQACLIYKKPAAQDQLWTDRRRENCRRRGQGANWNQVPA